MADPQTPQAEPGPLAVTEPADAGRQTLERDPFTGEVQPASQAFVVGELLEDGPVGRAFQALVVAPR